MLASNQNIFFKPVCLFYFFIFRIIVIHILKIRLTCSELSGPHRDPIHPWLVRLSEQVTLQQQTMLPGLNQLMSASALGNK